MSHAEIEEEYNDAERNPAAAAAGSIVGVSMPGYAEQKGNHVVLLVPPPANN